MTKKEKQKLEWLLARTGIGASEAAACLGLSKWTTKAEAYDDIIARRTGDEEYLLASIREFADKPDIKRGIALEPHIAEEYEQKTGTPLFAWPQGRPLIHSVHPWLTATPDFCPSPPYDSNGVFQRQTYIVEAKAPRGYTVKRLVNYGLTQPWVIQGQLQCLMANVDRMEYALLEADSWELHIIPVDFDAELTAKIVKALEEFWTDHILAGVRPMDELPSEIEVPDYDGVVFTTNDETVAGVAKVLIEARSQRGEWDDLFKKARASMEGVMKDADCDVLEVPGLLRVYWKHAKAPMRVDNKLLGKWLAERNKTVDDFKQPGTAPRPFKIYPLNARDNE